MKEIEKFFTKGGDGHMWWAEMTTPDATGKVARKGDRAELRRCKSPSDVMLLPAYHRLWWKATEANVARHTTNSSEEAAMAFVAGILAHVSENTTTSLGAAMGAKDGDNSVVSGLRFRKLLEIHDADQLYVTMIRIIRMLGRAAPIAAMADDLMRWNNEKFRDDVRKKWARDYYSTNPNAL
ncbi:MAG: type I-E CRISPR-associated protein Cse2/CasB [bacterium]